MICLPCREKKHHDCDIWRKSDGAKTWCDCAHKSEGVNWNLVDENGVPRPDPRRGG